MSVGYVVRVGLSSSLNASFHHFIETGYTREEWDEMSEKEQNEIAMDLAWQYVDVWVEEPDE